MTFPGVRGAARALCVILAASLVLPPKSFPYTARLLRIDRDRATLQCEIVEIDTLLEDALSRFIGENGGATNDSFAAFYTGGELNLPRPAADYFKSGSLSFKLDPDTNGLTFTGRISAGAYLEHPVRSTHFIDAEELIHAIDEEYHIIDARFSSHPEFRALLLESFTAYRLRRIIQDSSFEIHNGMLQGSLRLAIPMPRIVGRGAARPSDFGIFLAYKNVRERAGRNRHLKTFSSSLEEYLVSLGVPVLKKGGEYRAKIELFPGFEQDSRLFREAGSGRYGFRTNCSVSIYKKDRRIARQSYDAPGVDAGAEGARRSSARNLGARAAEGIIRTLIKESFEMRE